MMTQLNSGEISIDRITIVEGTGRLYKSTVSKFDVRASVGTFYVRVDGKSTHDFFTLDGAPIVPLLMQLAGTCRTEAQLEYVAQLAKLAQTAIKVLNGRGEPQNPMTYDTTLSAISYAVLKARAEFANANGAVDHKVDFAGLDVRSTPIKSDRVILPDNDTPTRYTPPPRKLNLAGAVNVGASHTTK